MVGGVNTQCPSPACITLREMADVVFGGENRLCDTLHVVLNPFLFWCRCHGAATTHQLIRRKHPHDHRL